MKKGRLVLFCFLTVVISWYLFVRIEKNSAITSASGESPFTILSARQSSGQQNNQSGDSVVLTSAIKSELNPPKLADRAGAVPPASDTSENIPLAIVLENVSRAIRQYGSMFGGNPVGTNPEITAALNGNNPKQINFIQPDAGMRLNDKGELVDPWGTPLFFHQLSGTETEIRSAGPDQIMWTLDDIIAK